MLTPDDIEEMFDKRSMPDHRWIFSPRWNSPLKGYRYALTFLPAERRFILAKQKIQPLVAVEDEELQQAFRSQLSETEIADCMRAAITPPEEEDIPF